MNATSRPVRSAWRPLRWHEAGGVRHLGVVRGQPGNVLTVATVTAVLLGAASWWPPAAVPVAAVLAVFGYFLGRWSPAVRLRHAEHYVAEVEQVQAALAEQQWWLRRELEVRELQVEELEHVVRELRLGASPAWFDAELDGEFDTDIDI